MQVRCAYYTSMFIFKSVINVWFKASWYFYLRKIQWRVLLQCNYWNLTRKIEKTIYSIINICKSLCLTHRSYDAVPLKYKYSLVYFQAHSILKGGAELASVFGAEFDGWRIFMGRIWHADVLRLRIVWLPFSWTERYSCLSMLIGFICPSPMSDNHNPVRFSDTLRAREQVLALAHLFEWLVILSFKKYSLNEV